MMESGKIEKVDSFNHSIIDHREKLSAIKPLLKAADVPHKDVLIPLQNNVRIPVRIYRPRNITSPCPTLFYVPGTAFVASEIVFTEVICTHIAEKSNCQVIIINHRLAPENEFPKGLNDAYSILRFIVRAPRALFQIDQSKVGIVGYSSGGNFAASMALYGKEEGLPIARQVLISPILDLSRSLRDFKDAFEKKDTTMTDAFVDWFLNLYVSEDVNPKNPWLSPFWHKPTRMRSLPPTDIIFAEYDRFRSDAEAYYSKLRQAGVDAHELMVAGEDHSFLWYKLEVVEAIGARMKLAFGLESIPRQLSSQHENRLCFISPRIKKDDREEHSPAILRAKL